MRRPQRRSSARLRRRSRPPVPVKARSSPANGQRAIAMVTDTRMDRILRRAGWPLKRLGALCTIGSTEAVAGLLAVTDDTLRVICASAGVSGRVLPGHEPLRLAACALAECTTEKPDGKPTMSTREMRRRWCGGSDSEDLQVEPGSEMITHGEKIAERMRD